MNDSDLWANFNNRHLLDLTRACNVDRVGERKKFGVVGLGPAGSFALQRLTALGHEGHGYEVADAPGGRTRTLIINGQILNTGAMRVGLDHETLEVVQELGLPIRRFVNENDLTYVSVRGVTVQRSNWASMALPHLLNVDEVPPAESPQSTWHGWMERLKTSVPEPDLAHAHAVDLGRSSDLRRLSEITLGQALQDLGIPDPWIQIIGHATGMHEYMQTSALEILLEHLGGFSSLGMVEPVAGMSAIVDGLLKQVPPDRVHLNHEVTGVSLSPDGERVTLHWTNSEGSGSQEFDYIILAIPAPAAARLSYSPAMPALQLEALHEVPYVPAAKSFYIFNQRFWEQGPHAFAGGISYVDGRMIVYPSNNAVADHTLPYRDRRVISVFGETVGDVGPGSYVPLSGAVSRGPGCVVIYRWGAAATEDMNLFNAHRTEDGLKMLTALHGPAARMAFARAHHVSWRSAFRHDTPFSYLRYEKFLRMPYPLAHPRVFLAGEHVGPHHGWIRSALLSAMDAVMSVAAAPSPRRQTQRTS